MNVQFSYGGGIIHYLLIPFKTRAFFNWAIDSSALLGIFVFLIKSLRFGKKKIDIDF